MLFKISACSPFVLYVFKLISEKKFGVGPSIYLHLKFYRLEQMEILREFTKFRSLFVLSFGAAGIKFAADPIPGRAGPGGSTNSTFRQKRLTIILCTRFGISIRFQLLCKILLGHFRKIFEYHQKLDSIPAKGPAIIWLGARIMKYTEKALV